MEGVRLRSGGGKSDPADARAIATQRVTAQRPVRTEDESAPLSARKTHPESCRPLVDLVQPAEDRLRDDAMSWRGKSSIGSVVLTEQPSWA